jgi:hypothetical protein
MDQATQQNAVLVEESAAAAESLKMQARQLVQAVAAFKLNQRDDRQVLTTVHVVQQADMLERRGPNRAHNVVRPNFNAGASRPATVGAAPVAQATDVKTGTDDWESF